MRETKGLPYGVDLTLRGAGCASRTREAKGLPYRTLCPAVSFCILFRSALFLPQVEVGNQAVKAAPQQHIAGDGKGRDAGDQTEEGQRAAKRHAKEGGKDLQHTAEAAGTAHKAAGGVGNAQKCRLSGLGSLRLVG